MEPWRTDNWWTSEYNYHDEVRGKFNLPKKVAIHDATLRDGEQMPGVVFRKDDKIEISKFLDDVGIDRIEAGMPAVSQEDYEAIKAISKLGLKADIYAFCRANNKDIDSCVDCGVDGVIIELPSGLPRLMYQFKWSEDEIIKRSIDAIKYAKERGLKVCYFPYDTTRAQMPFLTRLVETVAKEASPDSITVVDTTGVALPDTMFYLVKTLKQITDIPIEAHTHNDLGLGVATTLAAVEAGAEAVHVCVNGLGERCGNTPLEEAVVAITSLLGVPFDIKFDRLYELSKFVEKRSGVALAYNKPIVGDVPFTREIGLGMDVVHKMPSALLPIKPEFVGRKFRLVLGKKSGKESISIKLAEYNKEATEEQRAELLLKVKNAGIEKKRYLTEDEWVEIMNSVVK